MVVDHAAAVRALDLVDWKIPRFPKVTVTLAEPDSRGLAEMTIEGSAHATEEDVARALGIYSDPAVIRKHTSSTVGYVVSEDHRPPSAGALADRGIRRTPPVRPPAKVVDESVIEANAPGKPRARKAGRR